MSFGSNCGPTLLGDAGIGNGHAVDEPRDLVPSPDVQLVVDHVGARNKLRHDIHAVAAKRPGSVLDLIARHETFGGDGFQVDRAFRRRSRERSPQQHQAAMPTPPRSSSPT